MLDPSGPLSALADSPVLRDPVQALLLFRVYLVAVLALVSMAYLKYRTVAENSIATTYVLGALAFVFIIFGTGILGYQFPLPGLILSAGFTITIFAIGVGVGAAAANDNQD